MTFKHCNIKIDRSVSDEIIRTALWWSLNTKSACNNTTHYSQVYQAVVGCFKAFPANATQELP